MSFFTFLGEIDTWALASTLARRERLQQLRGEDGVRRLVVREPRENAHWDHPDLAKWSQMQTAIRRANAIIVRAAPHLEIAHVMVEMLEPGALLPWDKGATGFVSVQVGLVTNGGCALFCGNQSAIVVPGAVWAFNADRWHSAINEGQAARVHLVFGLRRRETEE